MSKTHPKLVSHGAEEEDAGLKFKGAPADDCDPFAIQNYIDRLAAEVYDASNPDQSETLPEGKDEWEHMKQKAKSVSFQDVSLSIALKHGLLDEVKKENANRSFEKESILTIMKVRDEFLRDYASASSFEYQWQIWVEWERYLKQIGVTIPQWGKIARKLIRLGVQRIQEDMTKKYSSSNKRKTDTEEVPPPQERRRRVTHPIEPYNGSSFSTFSSPMQRSSSFGGHMDPANPFLHSPPFSNTPQYTNASPFVNTPPTPSTPTEPYSPMQSPIATSPPFRPPFDVSSTFGSPSPFGASLYNLMQSAPSSSTAGNLYSTSCTPIQTSSSNLTSNLTSPQLNHNLHQSTLPAYISTQFAPVTNGASSIPYPYDQTNMYIQTNTIPNYATPITSTILPSSLPPSAFMQQQLPVHPYALNSSANSSPNTSATNLMMYTNTAPFNTTASSLSSISSLSSLSTPSPMVTSPYSPFSSPLPSPSPSSYMNIPSEESF